MTFEYNYLPSTMTTSHQTVSDIKDIYGNIDDELVSIDVSKSGKAKKDYFSWYPKDPAFFWKKEPKAHPATIGTATHLLLQSVDLGEVINKAILEEKLDQLITNKAIDEHLRESINLDNIVAFFNSDFGQKITKYHSTLKVEQPFSMVLRGKQIFENIDNETVQVLIHGIIDGYFETDEGLVLFDYKTDRFKDEEKSTAKQTLINKYAGQLNLYKEALETATNKKVIQAVIISLELNEVIDILLVG